METRAEVRSPYGSRRRSGQRLAVARAAAESHGAFTVDELTRAARAISPGIGTATVYRAVAALLASGFLERVGARAGSALYVHCGCGDHHHHLVCTGCGAVAEADCPLDDTALRAASGSGYVVTAHELTIYGLCPECALGTGGAPAAARKAR